MGMAKGNSNSSIITVAVTQALAAATAYHANDVMCSSAATGVQWTFAAIFRANTTYGRIVKATLQSQSENVVPECVAYVFNAAATTVDEDHAANTNPDAADLANYIGKVDFPALESLGTTDSVAVCTPSTYGNLPLAFTCSSTADDLFGVLVTRDAFTQTATDDITIKLTAEQY